MRTGEKYNHARHTGQVVKASKARNGGKTVLFYMCSRAEFDRPEVTITKEQIQNVTGQDRKTVQRALAFLRDEGSIVPIDGFAGGKGRAVTYKLVVIGTTADTVPQADPNTMRQSKAYLNALSRIMRDLGVGYGEAAKLADQEIGIPG